MCNKFSSGDTKMDQLSHSHINETDNVLNVYCVSDTTIEDE